MIQRRMGLLLGSALLGAFFWVSLVVAQGSSAADPYVAVVAKVTPPVMVQRSATDALVPLKQDDRLYPGDRLVCGEGGHASLIFADNAVELKLLPDSELTLQGQRGSEGIVKRIFLQIGKVLTDVLRGDMEVLTPTCVASVKGTRWWTTVDRALVTQVIVLEGEVRVQNRTTGTADVVPSGSTATSLPSGEQNIAPTQDNEIPSGSGTPQQGLLEIEFEDNAGQSKTLQIEYDH